MNEFFEFLEAPEESSVRTFSDDEGKDLFVGSLFYGYPTSGGKNPLFSKKLILDLNLLGDIRSNGNRKNLLRLFSWAGANEVEMTPLVALSEQQRSHADPRFAYDDYLRIMNEEFGVALSSEEVDKNYEIIKSISPNITENIRLQRHYLLVVKKFYRAKVGFKRGVNEFVEFILSENLPVFTLGLFLGCMYLHVKNNSDMYSAKLVSKIQSDMEVTRSHEARLMNVASDLALLQSTAEIFYNRLTGEYSYSFIASGDVTIHHALSELCWAQMRVDSTGNFGVLGFRPESIAGKAITDLLNPYSKVFSGRDASASAQTVRKENLVRVADQLFSSLSP
ncbi:hypothetical protein [Pseudomonas citronellolis]|uniref:hypothetical protein n=1 Tax=Pseudomonas citronellolis TaxID=53408 RepID=UPI0021BDF4C6|nr:hypothetical protein [Pseudomonas citronellolis]UXJ50303.1 hypothetical protein N5P21_20170 [Pseudomonas citronellolis]